MKFTCTYTQSETLLREYYYNVKKSGISKWWWLGLLLIGGSVAFYITTRDPIDLLFLVLGVALGIKELVEPYRGAKREYDILIRKYGVNIPETTVTVDTEKAVLTFDGKETVLPLDDVLGLYFCKNSLVLHGYSEDIILAHDGLENKDEIKAFLDKNCKNAPIYKR